MSWLGFTAVLVVTLVLQTAVYWVGVLPPYGIDLLLALALVYGLTAPLHEARLAAWVIGLGGDLMTVGPIGVHAVALGLTGLLATRMRETVTRGRWWTRWLIGLVAAVPGQLWVPLHLRFVQGGYAGSGWTMLWSAVWLAATAALLAALVTALPAWAPRRRAMHRSPWLRV